MLWEGDVFNRDCHSVNGGAGHVTITNDTLEPYNGPPKQGPPPLPPSIQSTPDMFKLFHYEATMVCKWTVGILLECCWYQCSSSICESFLVARRESPQQLLFPKILGRPWGPVNDIFFVSAVWVASTLRSGGDTWILTTIIKFIWTFYTQRR